MTSTPAALSTLGDNAFHHLATLAHAFAAVGAC